MSNYPAGFNPQGLAPIIIILDQDGAEQYRCEHPQLTSTPIQNIKVTDLSIHIGINSDHGYCQVAIDDRENRLLDNTRRKKCKIKNGWELKIILGKTAATQSTWFVGIIEEPQVTRTGTNLQSISLTAIGWGVKTAHRIGNIQRFQKKLADGVNLDVTDNNAKISEIFKDVLNDADVPAYPALGIETFGTDDVDNIDILIPDFQRKNQTLGLMLLELAQMAGAVYGIDANKNAFLRLRGSDFSGFLITNNLDPRQTKDWPQDKLMITRDQRFSFKESTIDSGYTVAHGLGAQHDTLDHNETAANATANISAKYYAFPFSPTKDNVSKLVPYLSKTSTPTKPLIIKIVGANSDGSPNAEDIRQTITISYIRLNKELGSAVYFEIPFDKNIASVSHGEKMFMLLVKYEDTVNPVSIDYQTGVGSYYDSTDGVTWEARTGQAKFRSYHSKTIHIIGQNCVARKTLPKKETMFSLVDFPNETTAIKAFEGMLESLGKIKRIYDPVIASAPTSKPDIGRTVKLIDKFNGMDTDVDLIGYDLSMSSFDSGNLTAHDITLLFEDWY